MTTKRSPTTKDVALLQQLFKDGQLVLAPEFQRNSVWPKAAKAYLIDTILNDRPMPLFFFQRGRSAQTGRPVYSVIDGQQRLTAIFEFLDDRFSLSASGNAPYSGKRFSQLRQPQQDHIRSYDIVVEELSGYSDDDIRDIFVRMNKYVVKLSAQELRHAKAKGAFHAFVEKVANWPWWREHRVFSPQQIARMRAVEFAAEISILLIEGPQDKKSAVDLYYGEYTKAFPASTRVSRTLKQGLELIDKWLPTLPNTRFRKPVDLYSFIGAIDQLRDDRALARVKPRVVRKRLLEFERELQSKVPVGPAAEYALAASRQTDNIAPRTARITILADIIRTA
jgi:hypothetical protein